MRITEAASAVARTAQPVTSEPRQVEKRPAPQEEPRAAQSAPKPKGEEVTLSPESREFAAKKTDTAPAEAKPREEAAPKNGDSARGPMPELSREITRNYSVEDSGQVVVKVIDKAEDKVIREIPPEEQRRIHQAIAKLNQESVVNAHRPEPRAAAEAGAEVAAEGTATASTAKAASEAPAEGVNVTVE
ncbi:MAG: flagellar protein FlaG [Nitrospinae bacterium]|nr:flagellar protein FlaG [Nitrospinota bacterium]